MFYLLISAQIILPSIAVIISFLGFILNLYIVNRSGARDRQRDYNMKADQIELEELEQKVSEKTNKLEEAITKKADKIDLEKTEKRITNKIDKNEAITSEKMKMQYEFMTSKQEETLCVVENMQEQIQTIYKKLIPDA